ncbi:MAG TPA: hypothetical protein VER96_38380 [Polyangiaceae bacterium]|nr:hypothetical protein [Polyangiaceae bacterium]
MTKLSLLFLLACLSAFVAACGPEGGTYCQSGPKYGPQCYSKMDLQSPGNHPTDPNGRPTK